MSLDKVKSFSLLDGILRRPPGLYGYFRTLLERLASSDRTYRLGWQAERDEQIKNIGRLLRGYGELNDFKGWKITTKSEISKNPEWFENRGLLPGYKASTGGTTGTPLRILRSPTSIVFEQATIDHICSKGGFEPNRSRLAVLRGDFVKSPDDLSSPFWKDIGAKKRIFSSFHLSKHSIYEYVGALRAFKPDILSCYPSSLRHLIDLINNLGEDIKIPCVFTSSELLDDATRKDAQNTLGAYVIDYYGQAERVAAAYALNNSNYFFIPAYGRAEIVHVDERPIIVGTPFWNNYQPLIRYTTGDEVILFSDTMTEDVCLGMVPFGGIRGRVNEYIDLPNGVRVIGLNHVPRMVVGASSIQLQFNGSDTVEAFIVCRDEFSDEDRDVLFENFYSKFPSEINLELRFVDRPIRTQAGKAPLLLPYGTPTTDGV